MKLKRLVRDTCVLIAFCGAFYLLTVFVSRLDASGLDDGSDFSVARQQADEFWTNRDYASAADEYKKLTEADPFNGHAWHTRALCYYNMRSATLDEIRTEQFELARAEAGKRGLSSVGQLYAKPDFEFTDSPRVLELKAKIKSLNEKARPIFLRAKEFARFRGNAALYLAVIESYEGNNEKALDLLEEYVELGLFTQGDGLDRYSAFGVGGDATINNKKSSRTRRHCEPRFWDIVARESLNKQRSGGAFRVNR